MKRRLAFTVRLREVTETKPSISVTVLAKNHNDAKKIAANMFPALRVWDAALVPDTGGTK